MHVSTSIAVAIITISYQPITEDSYSIVSYIDHNIIQTLIPGVCTTAKNLICSKD